jgi:hypothetical protein
LKRDDWASGVFGNIDRAARHGAALSPLSRPAKRVLATRAFLGLTASFREIGRRTE